MTPFLRQPNNPLSASGNPIEENYVRSNLQRQHEEYWGRRWAVALARHYRKDVRWNRPDQDPPDCSFRLTHQDGKVMTCWGEITGAYYSPDDAKWLWDTQSVSGGRTYCDPDSQIAESARASVERKLVKYGELVQQQGRGHLLALLNSPLTTRSTRIESEEYILDMLGSRPRSALGPFKSIWLGCLLPQTWPEEPVEPKYAFRESPDSPRLNFIKCIWIRSEAQTQH